MCRREPAAARRRSYLAQFIPPMATYLPRVCKRFAKASLCPRQLWRSCAPMMGEIAAPKNSRTSHFSSQNAGGTCGCAAGRPGDYGSALYVVRSLDVMHSVKQVSIALSAVTLRNKKTLTVPVCAEYPRTYRFFRLNTINYYGNDACARFKSQCDCCEPLYMRFHIKEKKHQDEIKRLVQSKDIDRMFKGKRHDVHFDMVRPCTRAHDATVLTRHSQTCFTVQLISNTHL